MIFSRSPHYQETTMRKGFTVKETDKGWEMVSDPSVPFDKQRAAFDQLPANHSENDDVKQVVLVRLSPGTTKSRHYVAKPKAAKKKAVKKEA